MRMTLIQVEGHWVAAEQAEAFRRDRAQVAQAMEALLSARYASVRRMTLDPEDGEGLAGCDAKGTVIFHFPLDPGNVARGMEALAAGTLEQLLLDSL